MTLELMTSSSASELPLAKVAFRNSEGKAETLWAFDLGSNQYCLDSSSWFQYGISWKDVVTAEQDADGQLWFQTIVEKSGHRTVRLRFDAETDGEHALLRRLGEAGCTFEGMNSRLFAIDVPPGVSLQSIRTALIDSGVEWEHADPTYEQLYGGAT